VIDEKASELVPTLRYHIVSKTDAYAPRTQHTCVGDSPTILHLIWFNPATEQPRDVSRFVNVTMPAL
jgi:hypothetical protein